MRILGAITVILAAATSSTLGSTNSLAQFCPKFSTNTQILWATPTNQLPKSLWIYHRLPARPFPAPLVAAAANLASLRTNGFPSPSTNSFFIWSQPNACGMGFAVFSLQPDTGTISFCSTNQNQLTNDVPNGAIVMKRAFESAKQFGLNQAELMPKTVYDLSTAPGCDSLSNGVCGRGICLSRILDGFSFYSDTNEGEDGFSVEFGSGGKVRAFSFVWPRLERLKQDACIDPRQIVRCILEQRIIFVPDNTETDYYRRLARIATAKTFTIRNITPMYGEGVFGEVPTNSLPAQFIRPFAEGEAVADLGTGKTTVQFVCPIVQSDFDRLMLQKGN